MGPDPFIETNINGAHDLLKVVLNTGPKKKLDLERCRFHQGSTDEVYGSLGPDDPAFSEVTRHVPPIPRARTRATSSIRRSGRPLRKWRRVS